MADRAPSRADGGAPTAPGALHGPGPDKRPRPEGRRTDLGIRVEGEAESEHPPRRAVVSAVVDHEPGVLSDVSGLFSRRQFNIESLTVGPTADEDYARITLVVEEPDPGIEQVKKQLETLLSVREVRELEESAVERETALVEVRAEDPDAVRTAARTTGGEVVDTSPGTMTVSVTGPTDRVDAAIERLAEFGIREVARTGATALSRGETPTTEWPRPAREEDAADGSRPEHDTEN
ncbi:acetolactate synthase small subunit [Halobacteriales archaeon QS_8_69_26]|nr:MAG: acetolactate synthase small subunit [Halobacteriales archaeon QS_8_69_26]